MISLEKSRGRSGEVAVSRATVCLLTPGRETISQDGQILEFALESCVRTFIATHSMGWDVLSPTRACVLPTIEQRGWCASECGHRRLA
jgi:hypothetical protein